MRRSDFVIIGEQLSVVSPSSLGLTQLQVAKAKSALSILENEWMLQELNEEMRESRSILRKLDSRYDHVDEPANNPQSLLKVFAEMESFRVDDGWELTPLAGCLCDKLLTLTSEDWKEL